MTVMPFLQGHYEPQPDETSATDLKIEGTLPPELSGYYIRNGHNPRPGITTRHYFQGQGMLHGVRLSGGRAEWYRNRWVRTPAFDGAPQFRDDGSIDLTASNAGTHLVEHGGRLLALNEVSLPFEVTPELDTVGAYDFAGTLTSAMTAHPKEDPDTGELHFFSYSPFPPFLTYLVASPEGQVVRSQIVDGAGPSLMHDFAITSTKAVFIDHPVVFDPAEGSGVPYRWHDDHPARIGIMDRVGEPRTTWITVDQGALLHVSNAYDTPDGKVVLEGPRFDRSAWETSWKWWIGAPGHPTEPAVGSVAHRWVLDPRSGTVSEQPRDDLVTELPSINDSYTGRPSQKSYQIAYPGAGLERYAVVKLDSGTGERTVHELRDGQLPGEARFVPAAGATAEDDGYLLTIVSDIRLDSSHLLVLDAQDLSTTATVHLPRRVTPGLHGSWVPDTDLAQA